MYKVHYLNQPVYDRTLEHVFHYSSSIFIKQFIQRYGSFPQQSQWSQQFYQPQADLPEDSCTCDFRLPYNPGSTCHVPGRYMRNADPLVGNSDVPSDSMFKSKDLHDLSIVDSVTMTGFWWEWSVQWIESLNPAILPF